MSNVAAEAVMYCPACGGKNVTGVAECRLCRTSFSSGGKVSRAGAMPHNPVTCGVISLLTLVAFLAIGLIGLAVGLLVLGTTMRHRGYGVLWSWFWGFAENSTTLGKVVYMTGAVILIVKLNMWAGAL